MKWRCLFVSNRPATANKILCYNPRLYTKTPTTIKPIEPSQPLQSLTNRVELLIRLCKNAIRKNTYFTLTVSFVIWMLFFDSADLVTQYKLIKRIKKLYTEQTYYLKQIEMVTQEREELISSEELLEKFAREKYLMKKPTEDIYVIEE